MPAQSLSDDDPGAPLSGRTVDRRFYQRHLGRGRVIVYRDSDVMRQGLDADLDDISVAGARISLRGPLQVGEPVRLRLLNEVQRFEREIRAIVRWLRPLDDVRYQIGLELLARLNSLDLQMLRRAGMQDAHGEQRFWL